jgi:serine/threonine-protein kinase
MAAIAPASSADLLDLIRKSHILPAEQLAALPALADLPAEPTKAATALVRAGFVTKFQATQLLAGRHKGFRVGPYVIHDLLGRGGMGAVYLGVHLELQRKVAIKVLAPGTGEDQRLALERFLREACAAAALDHPNIVRIFDVARHNESPYLVMEYVDGETLQQTLDREGRVPHDVAAEYVAQAAAGLQHAHEKGFVHRDIKPGNLIRDRFGTVKVLDMGLARSASDKDKLTEKLDEGAVVGTADFIAPEQAINSPDVDGRADIYSLGATLFTLVCGKTPFDGNTTQKLMQHQMKAAPPLTGVPAELTALVARMLEKKPGARFQTAAEVIAALAPWTGASARVIAGLSRTAIGQGDSRTRLGDWSLNGSSSRLRADGGAPSSIDAAALDPTQASIATAALSASETARSRTPARLPVPEPPARNRKTALLAVGLAAGVLVAGIVIGWLAFGR